MTDILSILTRLEEGWTPRKIATDMDVTEATLFSHLNNHRGISYRKIRKMISQGVPAQTIYDQYFKIKSEELVPLMPEESPDQTDVGVTHELLRNILTELRVMNGRSAIFYPPPHVRVRPRVEEQPPEEFMMKPKKKKSPRAFRPDNLKGDVWTPEEDEALLDERRRNPVTYAQEFHRAYPKRTEKAAVSHYWQLQKKKKVIGGDNV